jgi:hypothetical protein
LAAAVATAVFAAIPALAVLAQAAPTAFTAAALVPAVGANAGAATRLAKLPPLAVLAKSLAPAVLAPVPASPMRALAEADTLLAQWGELAMTAIPFDFDAATADIKGGAARGGEDGGR